MLAACSAAPPAPPLPPGAPQELETGGYFSPPSDLGALHWHAVTRIRDELAPRFSGLNSHDHMLRPGTRRGAVIAH